MRGKLINLLIVLLILVLPFQNLIAQLAVQILGWPLWIVLWKEVLVIILTLALGWEIVVNLPKIFKSPRNNFSSLNRKQFNDLKLLTPIGLYLASVGIISFSSAINKIALNDYLFGFRNELFWLGLFAVIVSWCNLKTNDDLKTSLTNINLNLLIQAVKLSFWGVTVIIFLSFIFGVENFYQSLGYRNDWSAVDSVFLSSPSCHTLDTGSSICRLTAGFASPNHLAAYLLLVIGLLSFETFNKIKSKKFYIGDLFQLILAVIFLILTYSRFAYISLGIWGLILISHLFKTWFWKTADAKDKPFPAKKFLTKANLLALLLPILLMTLIVGLQPEKGLNTIVPEILTKSASSKLHYSQKRAALEIIFSKPKNFFLGYGLSQSGSNSQPQYQGSRLRPIISENLEIANKYSIQFYNLAIPESWYLQLILNGGIFYFLTYFSLVFYGIKSLISSLLKDWLTSLDWINLLFGFSFYSILVGNLFLHIWENQTVSIYFSLTYLIYQLSYEKAGEFS